ncbi:unnamed protein product [Echinostoma caproni]|uniref:Serine/arginine repetitive matrix protein 2 n=1 Tax=Echinostoma caproni TaxID=27848 RepID=A0A183A8A6_9TREM|nr:unnamed protein product [Echinostoma caproni]
MGFLKMDEAPGYHHAIVLSPATYARHMFPEDIARNEAFWKSEDSAWHLATQLMSRYSTLNVLGFRASFPIPPDVWSDATKLNACFFSQASRIIILVPSDAESHIVTFSQTCLCPLLTKTEEQGGHPEWRERFVAAVIGNVRVPTELAPGVPFIKVVRFREIGWVRDITAMMLLQRAIQEFWVPSHARTGPTRPYWNWAGGNAQSSCQLSETIETKTVLGMCTHVSGQMETPATNTSDLGRSKSVDSRCSSSRRRRRRRHQQEHGDQTVTSRSRSRSQHSSSSGYRSLDPEFEAQQTEELIVDTRVINVLDGTQPIYLVDVMRNASAAQKVENSHASKLEESHSKVVSKSEHTETNSVSENLSTNVEMTTTVEPHADPSVLRSDLPKKPPKPDVDELSFEGTSVTKDEEDTGSHEIDNPGSFSEPKSLIERKTIKDETDPLEDTSLSEKSTLKPAREVDKVIDDNLSYDHSQKMTTSVTKYDASLSESSQNVVLSNQKEHLNDRFYKPDQEGATKLKNWSQRVETELQSSVTTNRYDKKKSLGCSDRMVSKQACGVPPDRMNEGVECRQNSPILVSRSEGDRLKSPPPPPLPPKTKASFIFSQMFYTKQKDKQNSVEFPLPYINSDGVFKKQETLMSMRETDKQIASHEPEASNKPICSDTTTEREDSEQKRETEPNRSPPVIGKHCWGVVNTEGPLIQKSCIDFSSFSYEEKRNDVSELDSLDASLVSPIIAQKSSVTATPSPQMSMSTTTNHQDIQKDSSLVQSKTEPLSVVHHIPVVLAPTVNQAPDQIKPVHEMSTKPTLISQPVSVQTRSPPVNVERVVTVSPNQSGSPSLRKKHVSYSTETITCEHTISECTEISSRSMPAAKRLPLLLEHQTDAAQRSSPHVPIRARSTTPEQVGPSWIPPRSRTISEECELTSRRNLHSSITPSGRVLYFRSAAPSRVSGKDFGSYKLPRSLSSSRVRLAEPTVLTGSLSESPNVKSRPRVHIYPSPWRPIYDETVADATTQMAGPLATGYMESEGVRCYAFTGTHYRKTTSPTPRLVVYKDTSVWTGPDATETYRLEVMFATRARIKSPRQQSLLVQSVPMKVDHIDVVDAKPSELQALPVSSTAPDQTKPSPTSSELSVAKSREKLIDWKTILLFILSCFVALIALTVAYFCLFSDPDNEETDQTGTRAWFQTFTSRLWRQ